MNDLMLAALAAAAEVLSSGAGPNGQPSRAARRRAKAILDLVRDEDAAKEILREVDHEDAE